jgi:hypothetical protein
LKQKLKPWVRQVKSWARKPLLLSKPKPAALPLGLLVRAHRKAVQPMPMWSMLTSKRLKRIRNNPLLT